ncbi:MAG: hypothetical protein LBI63_00285 [Candidatus Ancillula sp.]|jgi:elongation factor P hydroxylase|nr:hypothetical protein [Candidatus Ancillula sp.]
MEIKRKNVHYIHWILKKVISTVSLFSLVVGLFGVWFGVSLEPLHAQATNTASPNPFYNDTTHDWKLKTIENRGILGTDINNSQNAFDDDFSKLKNDVNYIPGTFIYAANERNSYFDDKFYNFGVAYDSTGHTKTPEVKHFDNGWLIIQNIFNNNPYLLDKNGQEYKYQLHAKRVSVSKDFPLGESDPFIAGVRDKYALGTLVNFNDNDEHVYNPADNIISDEDFYKFYSSEDFPDFNFVEDANYEIDFSRLRKFDYPAGIELWLTAKVVNSGVPDSGTGGTVNPGAGGSSDPIIAPCDLQVAKGIEYDSSNLPELTDCNTLEADPSYMPGSYVVAQMKFGLLSNDCGLYYDPAGHSEQLNYNYFPMGELWLYDYKFNLQAGVNYYLHVRKINGEYTPDVRIPVKSSSANPKQDQGIYGIIDDNDHVLRITESNFNYISFDFEAHTSGIETIEAWISTTPNAYKADPVYDWGLKPAKGIKYDSSNLPELTDYNTLKTDPNYIRGSYAIAQMKFGTFTNDFGLYYDPAGHNEQLGHFYVAGGNLRLNDYKFNLQSGVNYYLHVRKMNGEYTPEARILSNGSTQGFTNIPDKYERVIKLTDFNPNTAFFGFGSHILGIETVELWISSSQKLTCDNNRNLSTPAGIKYNFGSLPESELAFNKLKEDPNYILGSYAVAQIKFGFFSNDFGLYYDPAGRVGSLEYKYSPTGNLRLNDYKFNLQSGVNYYLHVRKINGNYTPDATIFNRKAMDDFENNGGILGSGGPAPSVIEAGFKDIADNNQHIIKLTDFSFDTALFYFGSHISGTETVELWITAE